VATKNDALDNPDRLKEFSEFCAREGLEFHSISAATGQGLKELLRAVERQMDALKQVEEEAATKVA
jgi:predicted GTPase